MKVLSLFDGISCARVALDRAGIPVDEYYASEIDKYAIQISQKNYPDIIQIGSVTDVKSEEYKDIDLLIGGSPCQDLSIAKKDRKGLDGERSLVKCSLYKNPEEQEKGLPLAVGHAEELRDFSLHTSKKGEEYESVNYGSWTENAETSAEGRAYAKAGFETEGEPSQEEMDKMNRARDFTESAPTEKQLQYFADLCMKKQGITIDQYLDKKGKTLEDLTYMSVKKSISILLGMPDYKKEDK